MPKTASPNKQQLEAIRTAESPLLIIAGPGSGKTFTLVERVFHLINEKTWKRKTCWSVSISNRPALKIVRGL